MEASLIKKILIIFYIVGLAGFMIPVTNPYFKMLVSLTLLMNAGLILIYQKGWTLSLLLSFLFILFTGFGIEWIGVQTGILFGSYTYGTVLGPKLGGTSLIIGVNWLMLVLGSYFLIKPLQFPQVLQALTGALLMVGYDWVLEPVAVKLGMWSWAGGSIPIQNYIAWFVFAFLFHLVIGKFGARSKNNIAGYVFMAQLLFFILLRIAMQLHLL